MTKAELIDKMIEKTGTTKAVAEKTISAMVETIATALAAGDKVAIPNFGTFSVSERAARTGKNPQTGDTIQIPASKVPKFKPGKALKECVN